MEYESLEPFLCRKPCVAISALPWRQWLTSTPGNERFMPPGGTLPLADLAIVVRSELERSAEAGAGEEAETWLVQVLSRDERRGLLMTYVPDLTMSMESSPFIPSRLDVDTRARIVANLIIRAFRPKLEDAMRINEQWVRIRLDPRHARWFATLRDITANPTRYTHVAKAKAFRRHREIYGDKTTEEMERIWDLMVQCDPDHEIRDQDRALFSYGVKLCIVAKWVRKLGFKHIFDFDTIVDAPPDRRIASDAELQFVCPLPFSDKVESNAEKIQIVMLWFHGIVPDAVSTPNCISGSCDGEDTSRWKLRHVTRWTLADLK